MNIQDTHCEVGKNSRGQVILCVLLKKKDKIPLTRTSWFRKEWKIDDFPKAKFWKTSGTETKPKQHNLQATITNLDEELYQNWKTIKKYIFF